MAKREITEIKKQIVELETERDKYMQTFKDLDDQITVKTQEMSTEIRRLRGERGNAIVLVSSCKNTIERLEKVLANLEG